MAAAKLEAYSRRRLICLLPSAALAAIAAPSAYAQTMAAPATMAPASAAPANNSAAPATDEGGNLGLPTLRLSGLTVNSSAQVTQSYTSNALGVSAGPNSEGSFFTTLGFSFDAHDHTGRLDADLAYGLAVNIYEGNSQYSYISNNLTALANATLVPDRLFLQGSAFVAPLLLNNYGPLNAGGTNSGIRNTYGYIVSPELRFRLGQFARVTTVVSQSAVFFDQPGGVTINQTVPGIPNAPTSFVTYSGTETLSSGPDFYRVAWAITGSASKATQGNLDYEQEAAVGNLRYAIDRAISVTGTFGYEWYSSKQVFAQSFSGPVMLGGLNFTPSENFRASASAGIQFGSTSYTGSLFWGLGAFTSVQGSLTDGVTTPAGLLLGNLSSLGVNGSGAFYNASYVNPTTPPTSVTNVTSFNPALGGVSLTTGLARYRLGALSLVHIDGRTQYRVTGYRTSYHTPGPTVVPTDGTGTGVEFVVSRTITPRLNGEVTVSYTVNEDFGNRSEFFQSNAGINYELSRTIQASLGASYWRRGQALSAISPLFGAISPISGGVSIVSVFVGISKQLR